MSHREELAMNSMEVLQRMADTEPGDLKWLPIEHYASLLAELERMLSDWEIDVLIDAGARLVRLSYPEVVRARQM